ncbi:MAG TPA: hypothetical protein VN622_05125 [Clostridia bacterium]|nr:hypothetical protein [Clostridia bacterium]
MNSQKRWSNTQAYGLAIICLLLGITSGYLIHGPATPAAVPSDPHQHVHELPPEASAIQPTPDQLKHMADKQTEPLLAKLEANPNDPDLLVQVGKAYLYARQFQTSIEYFEKSVKIKPDARVLTTLGGAYHFAGADDKALDAWDRALRIDPGYGDALVNIGLVKLQTESNPKAAIAAWRKMLKANPNHPQRAKVEAMIASAQEQIETRSGK